MTPEIRRVLTNVRDRLRAQYEETLVAVDPIESEILSPATARELHELTEQIEVIEGLLTQSDPTPRD